MGASGEMLYPVVFAPGGGAFNQERYNEVEAGNEDIHCVMYTNINGGMSPALVFLPHAEGQGSLSAAERKTIVDMAELAARRNDIAMRDAEYLTRLALEDALIFFAA